MQSQERTNFTVVNHNVTSPYEAQFSIDLGQDFLEFKFER